MGLTSPPPPLATAAASAASAASAAAAAATRQYLHPTPKPIGPLEFSEAVRAAAPPRFPHARTAQPRRIGIAVSGGVDSMALAFLFNRLREATPLTRVVDNPLAKISAFVVDHGLRPGSDAEAQAVARELRSLRYMRAHVDRVNWRAEGVEGDPAALPNVESAARRARYRRLGIFCAAMRVESLFLAHHQDDQHETVLMRLLAGHGSRGLRGISAAANIPECYDMHGVYESGHVDSQMLPIPDVSFRPPRRDLKSMRKELRSELNMELYNAELRAGLQLDWHEGPYISVAKAAAAAAARNMPLIRVEDAGVMIYRPLLGFGKDRLVATCEANKVRWFEDATNEDRTLTMRNAVRHMVRQHALPEALRKDGILRLAARCDARVRAQEQEAERWIRRGVSAEFEPNVGTLAVRLPDMGVPAPGRRSAAAAAARGTRTRARARKSLYDDARRELRLAHRRLIAALVVRRLLVYVSPDRNPPQLSSLQTVVGRLFPSLADPADGGGKPTPPAPPKAFNQASVLFHPVGPGRWYLVREPYPSLHPGPECNFYTAKKRDRKRNPVFPPTNRWYSWRRFQLWDGRFWIRVRGRVKAVFRVAPFAPVHGKAIGVTGGDDGARARLEGMLKRFAPGKVRYTLPALYAVNRDEETGEEMLRMLALPTIGVGLPGLGRWVQYEVRYRKVDMGLLDGIVGRVRGDTGGGGDSRAGGRGGAVLRKRALEEGKAEERVR
ncbi:hypothetical protein LX36DRAFT_598205, partial [Colletotrichum falcatum]